MVSRRLKLFLLPALVLLTSVLFDGRGGALTGGILGAVTWLVELGLVAVLNVAKSRWQAHTFPVRIAVVGLALLIAGALAAVQVEVFKLLLVH